MRCVVKDRYGYTTTSPEATFIAGRVTAAVVVTPEASVKKGDLLLLLAREGKWWKVMIGDTEGYVPTNKIMVR